MRMGTRVSRCTPSGVGRGLGLADRADAGQGSAEARVAVLGSVRDAGVAVSVGERAEDAMGAGVGGKGAGERVNREEGDDCRVGVRVGGNVDGRKRVLSKWLRDISRPVIRRPWPGADWAAVGAPCSSVLLGAQRV